MTQRGGGCCIGRYAGGAYDYNRSRVDKIMLMRYRPIAPKPAATTNNNGSISSSATPENSESSPKSTTGRGRGRGKKRRYAAAKDHHNTTNKRSCATSRKTKPSTEHTGASKPVKTLSLLPQTPELKEGSMRGSEEGCASSPLWLSFADGGHVSSGSGRLGLGNDDTATVVSWVRVERVTETWPGGMSISDHINNGLLYGLGFTDKERVMSLDRDTCPGFVSDGENRVRWMNQAYKRMVAAGGGGVVEAWLVVEDGVGQLPAGCAAFTCRVRVVVATAEKEKSCCKTAPCDAWRMDCGGFAWRLDTAAALSLGR